ncbi:WW domain-containing oxidoreductase [Chaetomidium leptoderma]|uniref:WW domain-containing oxidoreductase n=1 Tax=Chaetomidium leptoderma TaxID=669021 RepID=A0AAN6ZZ75_9PEZI|nr:WW domain-containing oxidoreductase [Chaetomidium leptoderma]
MNPLTKTIVATGASSGLGFELVKHLLTHPSSSQQTPYRLILGARDVARTQAAYDALQYDTARHSLTVLPLDLSDLAATRSFARQALLRVQQQGKGGLDYLLLNAAVIPAGSGSDGKAGPWGWCEAGVVNHLSQHYLIHLLREKLVESKTRIVVVSSGAVRRVSDVGVLENDIKAGSGVDSATTYCQTKFVQLLGAHWWRRQLKDQCTVVAVSPGLIPETGLGRHSGLGLHMGMPDAKPVSDGAQSILQAFTRDDLPEDPERIFLTSWGEWWSKDVYGPSLDKALQDKWCPSKEDIEKEAGLAG